MELGARLHRSGTRLVMRQSGKYIATNGMAGSRLDGVPSKRCMRSNNSRTAHGHRYSSESSAAARPRRPWRGISLLAQARLHQLRRPDRADRDHAPGPGRAETLDLREALSARAQLLHGAARTRGAAARDLRRLD